MKNQWFGDVHDFRKYGLLSLLALGRAYDPIFIDWMLTADINGSTDGNKTQFAGKNRKYYWAPAAHRGIFQLQQKIWAFFNDFHAGSPLRDVSHLAKLLEKLDIREKIITSQDDDWEEKMRRSSPESRRLMFFDADNGISNIEEDPRYIAPVAIKDSLDKGFSVLIYQHNTRAKLRKIGDLCTDCKKMIRDECSGLGKEDIVCFKAGSVVFFLIEREPKVREKITRLVREEFTPRFMCETQSADERNGNDR